MFLHVHAATGIDNGGAAIMNLKKMHENLTTSWLKHEQIYQPELGSSALSTCVLVRHVLNNQAMNNISWNSLIQADPQKPLLLACIKQISQADPMYKELLILGLDAINRLALFTNDEVSQILAYANNINNKDVNQLMSVVEDLNVLLGTESDNIIKQLIIQDSSIKITTFGFRILTYLQMNLKIKFSSFHLDKLRWREAMLSKIILNRKNDEVTFGNFIDGTLPKWLSQDYCFISANRCVASTSPENLNQLASELAHAISAQKSTLSATELAMQIPASDLYYAHIILALKLIKPAGKVFLTIRRATWQLNQLNSLRRYLVENGLVATITFIKTSRIDPWILVCLSYNPDNQRRVYMLSENFYAAGGLKYRLNHLTTARIVKVLSEQPQVQSMCNYVTKETLYDLNYSLDPNVCLNFTGRSQQHNSHAYSLSQLCRKIFRGPGLYNNEISKLPGCANYYMIGHTALTDDGLDGNNLTPIPEYLYRDNATNYAILPGDIVMLSRATTNRVVLIPEGNTKYLANINILILRPDTDIIDPTYLYLLLNSNNGKSLLSSIEKGVTLKSISIKDLKNLSINILDLALQKEIADKYKQELKELNLAHEKFKQFMQKCQHDLLS